MIQLDSEFGQLKKVLMHRPGKEIDRLSPENLHDLLFNDIPYLNLMQKEHDEYVRTIKSISDAKVYIFHELLMEILTNEPLAEQIFEELLEPVGLKELSQELLDKHSTAQTAFMLTAGLTAKAAKVKLKSKLLDKFEDTDFLLKPKPNLYFMRDPAAFTQGGVIISSMFYPARQHETKLIEYIFKHHPDFKEECSCIDAKENIPNGTIEGGDVIILSNKALAIGNSERTNGEAIKFIADYLIGNGFIERVYEVMMPRRRTCMHLDTVFTMVDENLVITFQDAMDEINTTRIYRAGDKEKEGKPVVEVEEVNQGLIDVLRREIPHLDVIHTAFGDPDYASREQYFDGANVFAVAPRQVVVYNRNAHTNRALREADVEVYEINSSELSRGLGGPRCMTMSIDRKSIYRK